MKFENNYKILTQCSITTVESRSQEMRLKAQKLIGQLRAALQIELVKMPKKIRNMSFLQLCADFDGNSKAVMEQEQHDMFEKFMRGIKRVSGAKIRFPTSDKGFDQTVKKGSIYSNNRNISSSSSSTCLDKTVVKAKIGASSYALTTPAKKRGGNENENPERVPVAGEMILSANGSPLGTIDTESRSPPKSSRCVLRTVKKRGVPGVHIEVETLGNVGDIMSITNTKTQLSSEEKKDAKKQILDLQAQLASLMQQLN